MSNRTVSGEPIPEYPVGPIRSGSFRFLVAASPYGVNALVALWPDADPTAAFRRYLMSAALDANDEYPNVARQLREDLVQMPQFEGDEGETICLGDQWADIVDLAGYSVPADLRTCPISQSYQAVVVDFGRDAGYHLYRPVAFVRRGTPVMTVGASVCPVWLDPGRD